ncbi:MAG: NAD(P)/FAD-dependent oxidoreductase [Saccharospirillum sp.]
MRESIEHIVVVGGGQAGGWVCRTLRREGYQGRLSVVASEPEDFYERPPLSKAVLTDNADLPRLFPAADVESMNIDWFRPRTATGLNASEQVLTLDDGQTLSYDRLVLATGATPRMPVAHWANNPAVITLRSWQDAQQLKASLVPGKRLAVVGGGWIGLEVAASARKLGVDVEVYEVQPRLCGRSIAPEVAAWLQAQHEAEGVKVHLNVSGLDLQTEDQPGVRLLCDGQKPAHFDVAIVGAGVTFNLALAHQAGLNIEQGVVVDERGQTSDPAIFAAGDIAQHPQLGLCIQSWAFAQNQAMVVAKALLGQDAHYREPAWLWSDQYQHNIQILGIPQPDTTLVQREESTGPVFCSLDSNGRLAQMVAVNQPRAIKLGKRWMESGRVLDAESLADPTFNLMQWK